MPRPKTIAVRALQVTALALFLCLEAPLIALMGLLAAHFTFGVSQATVESAFAAACAFSQATVQIAPLCGVL